MRKCQVTCYRSWVCTRETREVKFHEFINQRREPGDINKYSVGSVNSISAKRKLVSDQVNFSERPVQFNSAQYFSVKFSPVQFSSVSIISVQPNYRAVKFQSISVQASSANVPFNKNSVQFSEIHFSEFSLRFRPPNPYSHFVQPCWDNFREISFHFSPFLR